MKNMRKKRQIRTTLTTLLILLISVWLIFAVNIKVNQQTEIIEVGTKYEKKDVASLFGIDVTNFMLQIGRIDENEVGEYNIKYYPILPLITYEKTIVVRDTQKPVIELEGESIVLIENIESYVELGFTATDNHDGDMTSKVVTTVSELQNGCYEINYIAVDSSSNVGRAKRLLKPYVGKVYLTFDDGPSSNITPKVLDVLKEKNVKASFFIIGFNESKENIIKRMAEEGHTIGMHGFSHNYPDIYASVDSAMENYYSLEKLLSEVTGKEKTKYIRFPGGSSNTISDNFCGGIMTEVTKRATDEGYVYFDWNVDSGDGSNAKTSEQIYQNVINQIKPGRTNVVLMHDASDKNATLEALEKIIDYCIQNGYCIKPIDDSTVLVQHNVSN